ncbi:hypothetical protein COJ77_06030 [Bacillus cereus]|uniref:Uncharacterized protein n=1 Tax=Bacillus cereus TaxID=1396 RepID=A0AA44TE68_BACCE|nr:hypothetical protein COJ55_22650 [Bacillus cereus]PFO84364.1 hypothetical protein COJ77_06030 [Bacillus cereus]PFR99707.1 hypothetical protein COK38_15110 [Bacillus cereus]
MNCVIRIIVQIFTNVREGVWEYLANVEVLQEFSIDNIICIVKSHDYGCFTAIAYLILSESKV